MENWSYKIKEYWFLHKREIKRYGLCVWLIFAGLVQPSMPLAWFGLTAAFLMYSYDRWGRPYAERGKEVMKGGKPHKDIS